MEKTRKLLSVIIPATCIVIAGCSSKSLYNATQQNRLQSCQTLYGAQKEECEARYSKDFETYERERQEVLSNDTP
ncbi:hypothetical protein [Alteromonas flava]|uniref:hypothetical protein n=1 Tax=Alteromonas flava TaxID=2048003 RepID=UPI000F5F522C|nr:hypothetical protein [Alteromonas flava]